MKLKNFASTIALAAALAIAGQAAAQTAPNAPAPEARRPNVLVWMLDDVGFAQLGAFGGVIDTPNIDRVAAMGLRYSNYHTAPICSASRAAFLTGRNPHSVHVGGHALAALPTQGHDAYIPAEDGTIADNLGQAGYVTFAIGKWDHLPIAEQSSAGPFNHWPLGQGFDRYYGFLAAETDNWTPLLYQDNSPISTPTTPGYHLNEDLADRAIQMISSRNGAGAAPSPFFMYWATGTAHAPHHAPADWIARYRGRFDMGWDAVREQILQRQVEQGLVPASTELAPRPEGMPAWDTLSADQRRLYARQMEVFAASLSYADAEFGRILDALAAAGELDNTIVIITSDNGASGEGAYSGTFHEHTFVNEQLASDADNMPFINVWGGPETYPHYSFGWAVAGNTPFRYYKQTTHEGGTHVPLIISWPNGIAARGEIRDQFAFVTDIAPTLLDALQAPLAATVHDVAQSPLEGRSLVATFTDPEVSTARDQYVELYGSKGLWSDDGWSIVTTHRIHTWDTTDTSAIDEPWELYNLNVDPGQTNDLAAEDPTRVAEMGREFDRQAALYNVVPMASMGESRLMMARRMQAELIQRGGVWRFPEPVTRIAPLAAPPILNIGYRMSADVTLASGRESGPIFATGGELGGVSFYLRAGRPVLAIRSLKGELITVEARAALPRGATRLELEFSHAPTARMTPLDIQVTIRADGRTLVSRVVNAELPASFAETFDIGRDDGRAVSPRDYRSGAPFEGELSNIVFDFSDILRRPAQ